MKLRAWMTGCVMGAVVGVQAGPTMLNFIPVADILRHREAMIAYSIYGSEKNIDPTVTHAHAITIGLFDRLEIGYDNDFKGSTTFNAKLLLLEEPEDGKWALSAGIMNWDLYGYSEPYAVARYDLPFLQTPPRGDSRRSLAAHRRRGFPALRRLEWDDRLQERTGFVHVVRFVSADQRNRGPVDLGRRRLSVDTIGRRSVVGVAYLRRSLLTP